MPVIRTLFALLLCAAAGWAAELRTLAGKAITGEITGMSDKEIVLQSGTDKVTTPLQDVLGVDLQQAAPLPTGIKYAFVVLTDGSQLQCAQVKVRGKQIELTLAGPDGTARSAVVVTAPLAAVSHLLMEGQDPAVRQEWQDKYLAKQRNEDLLVIKTPNGNQPLDGTLGEGDAAGDKVDFQVGKTGYSVALSKVHGMAFVRKTDADAPAAACKVYDVYRSMLAATKVELAEDGFAVTTTAGARVVYPKALVSRLDYSRDKLAYLSDLEPVQVVEKSTLDRVEHYRRDRNLDEGPLRLGGEKYAKGLALHSRTELTYDIGGRFREFKAVLGVDDLVGGDSQAVVRIEGDGRELFAAVVTRKDKPRPLNLDVQGVKQLRIVVGSQGLLDLGDHVDLADAKVSK
jgi:hypothetical protein